jgi:hypothetical protein
MVCSRIERVVLAVTIGALAVGGVGTRAGAVSSTGPRIWAKPKNLMVDTKTNLTGTGFPAKTKLTIKKCSATNSVVTTRQRAAPTACSYHRPRLPRRF